MTVHLSDAIDQLIAHAVREADRRRYAASLSFWRRGAHLAAAAQWQDLADNAARQRGSGNALPTGGSAGAIHRR